MHGDGKSQVSMSTDFVNWYEEELRISVGGTPGDKGKYSLFHVNARHKTRSQGNFVHGLRRHRGPGNSTRMRHTLGILMPLALV